VFNLLLYWRLIVRLLLEVLILFIADRWCAIFLPCHFLSPRPCGVFVVVDIDFSCNCIDPFGITYETDLSIREQEI
jgi:hypothetical protein